jgi:hypothetical protein
LDVLLSNALSTPAPLSIARYPPPDTAIPIFGTLDVLLETMSMYADALNPVIFRRVRRSLMGEMIS